MHAIASTPGALRLFAVSIVARLPLAMFSIGLLVHTERLTGSFAAAGVVTGAFAVSVAIGGPLLGGVVDRRGQTTVLMAGAPAAGSALAAIAVLPAGAPLAALVALAAVVGLANPPVCACMRTLLPAVLPDRDALRAAYAAEAAAVELTWISGPPLVLLVGALWSTGGALAGAGAVADAAGPGATFVLAGAAGAAAALIAVLRARPLTTAPGAAIVAATAAA